MGLELLQRLRRELRRRIEPELPPHPAGEMPREDRDVFLPLAKRRHMEDLEREPVEEILLEAPGPGEGGEIGIRGGDDADIDPHRPRTPHPLERAILHDPEELFLGFERDEANLVKEERAAIGRLEPPRPLPASAGERPLLVPEQLRLNKRRRQRRAVEGHKRPLPAPREVVELGRRQLLASSPLANQKHRPIDGRRPGEPLRERQKGFRATDRLFDTHHAISQTKSSSKNYS